MKHYKHALITGGSDGIGLALAKEYILNGYHVSLIARDTEKLNQAKVYLDAIKHDEQNVVLYSCDVTNFDAVKNTLDECFIKSQSIDVIINSAGISNPTLFNQTSLKNFHHIFAVNYFGTLHVIYAAMPLLLKQGYGQIVMISSAAALFGIYGHTSYASSKYALRGLAEALKCEYYDSKISISIVFPPTVATKAQEKINQIKPWQNKLISARAGEWQPDALAQYIYKKLSKKSFAILPGIQTHLLYYLGNFLKPFLFRRFNKMINEYKHSDINKKSN